MFWLDSDFRTESAPTFDYNLLKTSFTPAAVSSVCLLFGPLWRSAVAVHEWTLRDMETIRTQTVTEDSDGGQFPPQSLDLSLRPRATTEDEVILWILQDGLHI